MCRRRVKICKKVTCRIRSSRYRLYVPMVGLFRKPGRGRNACAVIIPKELTILRVGNTRSLISIGARRKSHTSSQLRGEDSNPGMHKEGLRKLRKPCARQGLPREYGLHNGYVSRPIPDMRWGRLVGSPSISRIFRQSRFDGGLGRTRPNQGLHRFFAT